MTEKTAFQTFILTLEDATDRQEQIINQALQYGLNYQLIYGTDFRKITQEEANKFYNPTLTAYKKNKFLTAPEIACSLSHQKIYQQIIENKIPFSLILEDDCIFLESPDFLIHNLTEIYKKTHFDILILGYVKLLKKDFSYHYKRLPIKYLYKLSPFKFGKPWEQFSCGTASYIITLDGAKKLYNEHSIINVTADDWLFFEKEKKANIIHIRPFLTVEDSISFNSNIRIEKNNFLKIKVSSKIIRIIKGIIKNFLMNYLRFR